jgi:hypothetical protein
MKFFINAPIIFIKNNKIDSVTDVDTIAPWS